MIDYIEKEDEATDFVKNHLAEVKSHLDMIAKETGQMYVAMPANVIGIFAQLGASWGSWMINAQKVCADRMVLALEHDEWMSNRHTGEDDNKQG